MSKLYRAGRRALGLVVACAAVPFALGQDTGGAVEAVTALPCEDVFVHRLAEIDESLNGIGTIDWEQRSNRLLLGKRGVNQYCNVYSVTSEGFRLKPLTLSKDSGASGRQHNGAPIWHPSGDYFVFTSQNQGSTDYRRSVPAIGLHCNLWLGNADGDRFWPLTKHPTSYTTPEGATGAHFSPDGKKLLWVGVSGRQSMRSPFGERALYLADVTIADGAAALSDEQKFQPGAQHDFYEPYGFSPDGNRILFAGNLDEGQVWYGMDLWVIDRAETDPINLTQSRGVWDRYASCSPDGKKIIWASSRGIAIRYMGTGGERWDRYLRTELWIMEADGSSAKRLTGFNFEGSPEYVGRRCFVGDSAWSSDGKRLAVVLHFETRNYDVESKVLLLELGEGAAQAEDTNGDETERPVRKPPPRKTPTMPKW